MKEFYGRWKYSKKRGCWAQAEADGRRRGWVEALDAARERIMRLPYEIDEEILVDRDEVIGWIDALRGEQ